MTAPPILIISPYAYVRRAISANLHALGVDARPAPVDPQTRQAPSSSEALRWVWRANSHKTELVPCEEAAISQRDLEVRVVTLAEPQREWLYYLEPEMDVLMLVGFEKLAQHIRERLLRNEEADQIGCEERNVKRKASDASTEVVKQR